jgi:hypothetical protein
MDQKRMSGPPSASHEQALETCQSRNEAVLGHKIDQRCAVGAKGAQTSVAVPPVAGGKSRSRTAETSATLLRVAQRGAAAPAWDPTNGEVRKFPRHAELARRASKRRPQNSQTSCRWSNYDRHFTPNH